METSSKYANLPGVVYDQPDVYESEDVNEITQCKSIDDTPNIELINNSYSDSFKKFDGNRISVSGVNFSTLPFGPKGYQTWGEWKLSGKNDDESSDETPLEKYHRLTNEITELKHFFNSLKSKSASKEPGKTVLSGDLTVADAYKNLEALGESLKQLDLDHWQASTLSSLPVSSHETLKNLKKSLDTVSQETHKSSSKSVEQSGRNNITYELHCKPGLSKNEELTLAQLEGRLRSLELLVGDSDKVTLLSSCTAEKSMSEAINYLSKKVSALDVNHLDQLDTRLTSLLQKLSTVGEKKDHTDGLDKEKDNRVNELLDLVASTEAQRSTLPVIVSRLSSLTSLEAEAAAFSESIHHLTSLQDQVANDLTDAKANLSELKKSLAENIESFSEAISKIEAKLK